MTESSDSLDLFLVAKAYVEGDKEFFAQALSEDENIRTDLGLGGTHELVVSPGQDTAPSTGASRISSRAAHFTLRHEMLKILYERNTMSGR